MDTYAHMQTRVKLLGGDADVDHTQTIGDDTSHPPPLISASLLTRLRPNPKCPCCNLAKHCVKNESSGIENHVIARFNQRAFKKKQCCYCALKWVLSKHGGHRFKTAQCCYRSITKLQLNEIFDQLKFIN